MQFENKILHIFWYLITIHLFLALSPVCHVLSGVAVPSAQRRTDSHQAGGKVPVCQAGGVCLFLVRTCALVESLSLQVGTKMPSSLQAGGLHRLPGEDWCDL